MADLLDAFASYIKQKKLLPKEPVLLILGLSAGVDSACLLDLFCRYRKDFRQDLSLVIHHQDHRIRDLTAEKDRLLVQEWAKNHLIPCFVDIDDVPLLADTNKKNLEDQARQVRYQNWRKLLEELQDDSDYKACKTFGIATAHHASDQAETLLLHLAYGAGLDGLKGILPKRDCFIRPLLFATKEQLYAYAEERKLAWREDETNLDTDYRRNFLRHELLPLWQEREEKNLSLSLARSAENLQDLYYFVEDYFAYSIEQMTLTSKDFFMDPDLAFYRTAQFNNFNSYLKNQFLVYLLKANGVDKNYGSDHIFKIRELLETAAGEKHLSLPGGVRFTCNKHYFYFCPESYDPFAFMDLEGQYLFTYSQNLEENSADQSPGPAYKLLAETLIPVTMIKGLRIRTYKSGDKVFGTDDLLKDYFALRGVPIAIRHKIPLLVHGKDVLAFVTDQYVSISRNFPAEGTLCKLSLWYNFFHIFR